MKFQTICKVNVFLRFTQEKGGKIFVIKELLSNFALNKQLTKKQNNQWQKRKSRAKHKTLKARN